MLNNSHIYHQTKHDLLTVSALRLRHDVTSSFRVNRYSHWGLSQLILHVEGQRPVITKGIEMLIKQTRLYTGFFVFPCASQDRSRGKGIALGSQVTPFPGSAIHVDARTGRLEPRGTPSLVLSFSTPFPFSLAVPSSQASLVVVASALPPYRPWTIHIARSTASSATPSASLRLAARLTVWLTTRGSAYKVRHRSFSLAVPLRAFRHTSSRVRSPRTGQPLVLVLVRRRLVIKVRAPYRRRARSHYNPFSAVVCISAVV